VNFDAGMEEVLLAKIVFGSAASSSEDHTFNFNSNVSGSDRSGVLYKFHITARRDDFNQSCAVTSQFKNKFHSPFS